MTELTPATGLALLRVPFPAHHISKLPKPTKAQTDAVKADFKKGIRCDLCGAWHHPQVQHLDYVGHAALTDRLLDADPAWTWDPVADPAAHGLPSVPGGMWIRLTVAGVSRYGFGCADGKSGGDAIKEVIGDALRNAAMRFGAALDLWHKGDLHADDEADAAVEPIKPKHDPTPALITDEQRHQIMTLATAKNIDARAICEAGNIASIKDMPAKQFRGAMDWLNKQPKRELGPSESATAELLDDEIPY